MRKIVKLTTGLLSLFAALSVLGLALFSSWAATGPRDLTKYAGAVEESINGALKDAHIKIGRVYLEWKNIDDFLTVKVANVEIYDNQTNEVIAAFPQVVLKYGLSSLVTGHVIPSQLKLIGADINLSNFVNNGESGQGISLEDFNLGRLSKISVLSSTLTTLDNNKWNINSASLWSGDDGIRINVDGYKDDGAAVQASVRAKDKMKELYIKASVTNFNTADLVYYIPEIAGSKIIVSGRASYTGNSKQRLASFSIDNFSGEFDHPEVFKYKHEVKTGSLIGNYDLIKKLLNISKLHVLYDDETELSGHGTINNMQGFDIQATLNNLRTANIRKYWPNGFGLGAITWMNQNLSGGVINNGTLKLKLNPGEAEGGKLPKQAVSLNFNFMGVGTTYMDGMMPITNGVGTGFLDGDSLDIKVSTASLGNSQITNAQALITGIGTPSEILKVGGHIEGPVDDLADFYIKLNKQQKLFRDRSDLSGKASSDLTIKLPLLDNLKVDDVEYDLKTQVNNGGVKNFFSMVSVDKLKLSLSANNKAYDIKGEGLASYGNDGDLFVLRNAPVGFSTVGKNGRLGIAIQSDITSSAIEFAPLEIKKAAGEPGKIVAEIMDAGGGSNPVVNKLLFDSTVLRASARGSLKRGYGSFAQLNFDNLEFGRSNLQARLTNTDYLTVELKTKYFDAAPIIRFLKKDRKEEDDSKFKIMLKSDVVGLMNNKSLNNVFVVVQCGVNCDVINIDSKEVMFNQSNGNLKVKTSNAGYVLDGFDVYSNMVGGKLDISAKANGGNYDGNVTVTEFSIVKAKVLARMLTLGSLTGIADILSGNGISFKKLNSQFHMDKHELTVTDYRMVGAAIGITAKGSIDRDKDIANVSGNIIPSYTANTLLGNIPLIGPVVIGNDGVFALAYTLTGNVDDPSISVNPLSVLAPGFLKNVFQ